MLLEKILTLIIYGLIPYFLRILFMPAEHDLSTFPILSEWSEFNQYLKYFVISVPEQIVLYYYEPSLAIIDKILISITMISIRVNWNGWNNLRPRQAYNDFIWIFGTALYAYKVISVNLTTAATLIIVDSIMTLLIRGLIS